MEQIILTINIVLKKNITYLAVGSPLNAAVGRVDGYLLGFLDGPTGPKEGLHVGVDDNDPEGLELISSNIIKWNTLY